MKTILTGEPAARYVALVNKAAAKLAPPGCVDPRTGQPLVDIPERGIFMTGTTKLVELDANGEIELEGPNDSFGELAVSRGELKAADKAELAALVALKPRPVEVP